MRLHAQINGRLEPSIPEPLGELREPGAVGFDDEECSAPVLGLDRGDPGARVRIKQPLEKRVIRIC
jgi:hypothetical protein